MAVRRNMLLGMALFQMALSRRRSRCADLRAGCRSRYSTWPGASLVGTVELERVRFEMPQRALSDLWNYTGAVIASVGYASAIILFVKSRGMERLRSALAAVGQMAFSNYLFHSIVTSIIYLGWGFGLAAGSTTRSSFS